MPARRGLEEAAAKRVDTNIVVVVFVEQVVDACKRAEHPLASAYIETKTQVGNRVVRYLN